MRYYEGVNTNACEYLARVGFCVLVGDNTQPEDEDDADSIEAARLVDHKRVREILLSATPKPSTGREGVHWLGQITWPDRMPGLKTWAGQQTLLKIITKFQGVVKKSSAVDLFVMSEPLKGSSGFDNLSCQDAIDIGFSPAALDMEVYQRPALELLAIVGLESLPLVSFEHRVCGFVHDHRLWKFTVEDRDGGYYHRWGIVQEVRSPDLRYWCH